MDIKTKLAVLAVVVMYLVVGSIEVKESELRRPISSEEIQVVANR